MAQIKVEVGSCSWVAHGSGSRRAISKSNKRNIIATRKNRIENGSRADPRGSKPHSYGDSFSGSGFIWASQKFSRVRAMLSASDIEIMKIIMFITLLWV